RSSAPFWPDPSGPPDGCPRGSTRSSRTTWPPGCCGCSTTTTGPACVGAARWCSTPCSAGRPRACRTTCASWSGPRDARPSLDPADDHPRNRKHTMTTIWDPITIKNLHLPHRLALAPLGLLISEGTQPSADGQGYLSTPGIYTAEHRRGWRTITEAVRAQGGHLFIQLMHAGRMSHPDNTPHHRQGVAPSAVAPDVT